MKHNNYFEFKASSHLESGKIIGEHYKKEILSLVRYEKEHSNWKQLKKSALPYLKYTQEYFPSIYDEFKGQCRGSGVDEASYWAVVIENELSNDCSEKCTTVRSSDGLLIAHNEDWNIESQDYLTVLKKTVGSNTIFELYYIGSLGGVSVSVNSNGIVQAVNSLTHNQRQHGVPSCIISKYLSECENINSSIAYISNLTRSSGFHHGIFSQKGECWSIESNHSQMTLTIPKHQFAHTNHYIGELSQLEKHATKSSISRLNRATDLLKNNSEIKLEDVINDTNGFPDSSIHNNNTIGKMIIDFKNLEIKTWIKREDKKGFITYPLNFIK